MLVTGSKDTTIKVFPLSEELLTVIKSETDGSMAPRPLACSHTQTGHDKDVNCIAVSPKDRLVATASEDRTIKVGPALTNNYVGWGMSFKLG